MSEIQDVNNKLLKLQDEYVSDFDMKLVSDGYHTFGDLYDYRLAYNALLFNEWARLDLFGVHKSRRHYTGELCFGGSHFIVAALLPTGLISNHYKHKYWELFDIKSYEKALYKYDDHTSKDVLDRMFKYIMKVQTA